MFSLTTKLLYQLKLLNLVTIVTNKIVSKTFLMLIQKEVIEIFFGKLLSSIGVSMALESCNQLKFLNLVRMATTKFV